MESSSINKYIFESSRLGFRMWKESDRELFAKINANEEVMRYFPKPLDTKESDGFLDRIIEHFKRPMVEDGSLLKPHVLYKIEKTEYKEEIEYERRYS